MSSEILSWPFPSVGYFALGTLELWAILTYHGGSSLSLANARICCWVTTFDRVYEMQYRCGVRSSHSTEESIHGSVCVVRRSVPRVALKYPIASI